MDAVNLRQLLYDRPQGDALVPEIWSPRIHRRTVIACAIPASSSVRGPDRNRVELVPRRVSLGLSAIALREGSVPNRIVAKIYIINGHSWVEAPDTAPVVVIFFCRNSKTHSCFLMATKFVLCFDFPAFFTC